MTLSRERGSNAYMGASFLLSKKLDISILLLLLHKFLSNKDLPKAVGLFHLEIELAYKRCWDKCGTTK